jgi:hypothetical protein
MCTHPADRIMRGGDPPDPCHNSMEGQESKTRQQHIEVLLVQKSTTDLAMLCGWGWVVVKPTVLKILSHFGRLRRNFIFARPLSYPPNTISWVFSERVTIESSGRGC